MFSKRLTPTPFLCNILNIAAPQHNLTEIIMFVEFKDVMKSLEDQRKFAVQFFETWVEMVEKALKVK
jgi:hypothetical protein